MNQDIQIRHALSQLCWSGESNTAGLDQSLMERLREAGYAKCRADGVWMPTTAGRFAAAAGGVINMKPSHKKS